MGRSLVVAVAFLLLATLPPAQGKDTKREVQESPKDTAWHYFTKQTKKMWEKGKDFLRRFPKIVLDKVKNRKEEKELTRDQKKDGEKKTLPKDQKNVGEKEDLTKDQKKVGEKKELTKDKKKGEEKKKLTKEKKLGGKKELTKEEVIQRRLDFLFLRAADRAARPMDGINLTVVEESCSYERFPGEQAHYGLLHCPRAKITVMGKGMDELNTMITVVKKLIWQAYKKKLFTEKDVSKYADYGLPDGVWTSLTTLQLREGC